MQKQHLHHLHNSHLQLASMVWPASSCWFRYSSYSVLGCTYSIFLGPFSELWQLTSWVQSDHQVVNFSTWYFGVYKTAHRMWLRILSITLEKELKSSLTVLNSCVIIIQSPLALFLCFHISLIKLILWLKFSTGKRQVEDTVRARTTWSCFLSVRCLK